MVAFSFRPHVGTSPREKTPARCNGPRASFSWHAFNWDSWLKVN